MLRLAALAVMLGVAAGPGGAPSGGGRPAGSARTGAPPAVCVIAERPPEPPEYYAFPVVSTRKVPGSALAAGVGRLTFAASPFGFALAPDGSYHYRVGIEIERLRPPTRGTYVVWITTPELDHVEFVGELGEDGSIEGVVTINKFLVVVTLEDRLDPRATRWAGPIVLRGMSRSGMMHTMAGHGPFAQENCAAYGY